MILEGLIGRRELPLNTAVGMPICSLGSDLCIMVLFSVKPIGINANAVEFLRIIARAASENSHGFISPSLGSSVQVTPANTDQFIGVWDIEELIKKYSSDISFHLIPIGPLQSFFDFQESMTLNTIINDASSNFASNSTGNFSSLSISNSNSMNNILEEFQNNSIENVIDESSSTPAIFTMKSLNDQLNTIDARSSYKNNANRYHEMMISLLEMTLFDAVEIWMLSKKSQLLKLKGALNRNDTMKLWTCQGHLLKIRLGQDIIGSVAETNSPFWDENYESHENDFINYPRSQYAQKFGIKTALGVPLPGPSGDACGTLVLFSLTRVTTDPLILNLATKAMQFLSVNNLGLYALTYMDIDNLVQIPQFEVSTNEQNEVILSQLTTTSTTFPVRFQMMGSIATKRLLDKVDDEPILCRSVDGQYYRTTKASSTEANMGLSGLLQVAESAWNDIIVPEESYRNEFSSNSQIKICLSEGCSSYTTPNSSYCSTHSRKCQFDGCNKCSQGSTRFCIAHNGGRRCTFPGCMKGARDKLFCSKHGGGRRCSFQGCGKAAVGSSLNCVQHGGGRRCEYPDCTKSSQASTKFCVKHNGGKLCSVEGCKKVSRGKSKFCAKHGNIITKNHCLELNDDKNIKISDSIS